MNPVHALPAQRTPSYFELCAIQVSEEKGDGDDSDGRMSDVLGKGPWFQELVGNRDEAKDETLGTDCYQGGMRPQTLPLFPFSLSVIIFCQSAVKPAALLISTVMSRLGHQPDKARRVARSIR